MKYFRVAFRFHAVLLRQRFEENRNLTDNLKVQTLVANAEEELFMNQHTHPLKCNIKHKSNHLNSRLSQNVLISSSWITWWSSLWPWAKIPRLGFGLVDSWRKGRIPRVFCSSWTEEKRLYSILGAEIWMQSRRT